MRLLFSCEPCRGGAEVELEFRTLSLVTGEVCWRPVGWLPCEFGAHGPGYHVLHTARVGVGVVECVVDGLPADTAGRISLFTSFFEGL